MSTPAEQAATDNSGSQNDQVAKTFSELVNEATDSMTQSEDGKWVFPEGLDEAVKFAANSERRRRDTQSALAQTKNEAAILAAEKQELVELVKKDKTVRITPEDQEELDELKFTDPDAWRKKMNDLERLSKDELHTTLESIQTKAKAAGSTGEREILLAAFLDDNPGLVITDEVIANDIPPRITKALESGEVTFFEFLGNVKEYITAGKVIADTPAGDDPNLSNIGGGDTPSASAQAGEIESTYEDAMF